MKQTKIIMGMPVTIEVIDKTCTAKDLKEIFDYFRYVDQKFSTYKKSSEISLLNAGKISQKDLSSDMKLILNLAEKTKNETGGYFDIFQNGSLDPSGIVKGWAIFNAAKLLSKKGFKNYYVDAGGDIETSGTNSEGKPWKIGIKNPFNQSEIVKVLNIQDRGVATSGTYIRGDHIYSPKGDVISDIVSLTVIGDNIYEADRLATAAFAMGKAGIEFIEKLPRLEGYLIDSQGIATYTSGFGKFEAKHEIN